MICSHAEIADKLHGIFAASILKFKWVKKSHLNVLQKIADTIAEYESGVPRKNQYPSQN